jgi:hypothetical protein
MDARFRDRGDEPTWFWVSPTHTRLLRARLRSEHSTSASQRFCRSVPIQPMRGFSRDPGELLDRDTMSGRDHAHAWPTLLAEMALLVQDETGRRRKS